MIEIDWSLFDPPPYDPSWHPDFILTTLREAERIAAPYGPASHPDDYLPSLYGRRPLSLYAKLLRGMFRDPPQWWLDLEEYGVRETVSDYGERAAEIIARRLTLDPVGAARIQARIKKKQEQTRRKAKTKSQRKKAEEEADELERDWPHERLHANAPLWQLVQVFERRYRPRRLPKKLWDAYPRIDFRSAANEALGEFLVKKLKPDDWSYVADRRALRHVSWKLKKLTHPDGKEWRRQCFSLGAGTFIEGHDGLIPIKLPRECTYGNAANGTDEERAYHAANPDMGMMRHPGAYEQDWPRLVEGMVADHRDGDRGITEFIEGETFEAVLRYLPPWYREAARLWVTNVDTTKTVIAAHLGRDRGQVHTALLRAIDRLYHFNPSFVEWYFRRHGEIFKKSFPTLPPSRI